MPVIRINGCYEQVAEVTERAMNGELDFNESLVERVKCLKGAPESVFDDVYNVIELTPGAEEFVWALQVWSETPIRDNSRCCCHPLTGVPCLRLGPRTDHGVQDRCGVGRIQPGVPVVLSLLCLVSSLVLGG